MLCLSVERGAAVYMFWGGQHIKIEVLPDSLSPRTRLGITAPRDVIIARDKILDEQQRSQINADRNKPV